MSTDLGTLQENNRRIAKNTLMLYVRMLFGMIVSLYTSRVVLITLGVEDYGIYNIVGSVVVMLSFISSPLGAATQRFYNFELGRGEKTKLNQVFNLSLYSYLVLALLLFAVIEWVGSWYICHKMSLPAGRLDAALFAFQFSLLSFVLSLIKTPYDSLIIAHERMSFYAYCGIFEILLRLGNAVSLLYVGVDKLELYAFNQFAISLMVAVCLAILQKTIPLCLFDARLEQATVQVSPFLFRLDLRQFHLHYGIQSRRKHCAECLLWCHRQCRYGCCYAVHWCHHSVDK